MSKVTSYLLLLSLTFFIISFSVFAAEKGAIINDIEIRGLQSVDEQTVIDTLTSKVGQPISNKNVQSDIKAIYKLGFFSGNITVSQETAGDGIKLIYNVSENKKIGKIEIIGNKYFNNQRILSSISYKQNDVLTTNAIQEIKDDVMKVYHNGGYYKTEVTVDQLPTTDPKIINIQIIINEGTKTLVKDMLFVGNKNVGTLHLKLSAATKGSVGFIKNYYDDILFRDDLDTIKTLYLSKGFFDAEVRAGEFKSNPQQGWISPVIVINEGRRYKVGKIEVTGNSLFSTEEILSHFDYLKGKYFSIDTFGKNVELLHNMYGNEGYADAQIEPVYSKNVTNATVDIALRIDEGQAVYVGNVKLKRSIAEPPKGIPFLENFYKKYSPPVKEKSISREITLRPGELYRHYQEVKTVRRLKDLGIFNSIKVHREPTDKQNVQDVVIDVKEGNTGNLGFGVGVGDVTGPFGFVSYTERNLFGEAKDLTAMAEVGTDASEFKISYYDRHYKDTDYSVRHTIFRNVIDRGDYDETRTGYNLEVGKPLDVEVGKTISEYMKDYFDTQSRAKYTQQSIYAYVRLRLEYAQFDIEDDEEISEDLSSYPIASVQFRLVDDTRDDNFWPTEGYYRSGGIELGAADGPLVKFTGNYNGIWKISRDLLFSQRFDVGALPYNADNVGITERLYMGGTDDLRGYKYRGIAPKDPENDDVPIGGSTKALSQSELRFPIYKSLNGLVFFDAGTLGQDAFTLGAPRFSTGVGTRLAIPIANIGIDLAQALNAQHDDDTQLLHFKVSSSF